MKSWGLYMLHHVVLICSMIQVLEMYDSNFTDLALAAVAKGCSQLASLSMQGPRPGPFQLGVRSQQPLMPQGHVTDAGLRAIAAHCTRLKCLHITRESCYSHV